MWGNFIRPAKFIFYSAIFILLAFILFLSLEIMKSSGRPSPGAIYPPPYKSLQTPGKKSTEQAPNTQNKTTAPAPPDSLLLQVPFTSQAPTANWDELHNEACEEAVIIMANAYFSNSSATSLPAGEVEKEIAGLTDWQNKNLGYFLNTTAAETARMAESVYGLKTGLIENFSEEQIRSALAEGKLIIIPENGRMLDNPYYKRPGPLYHMILIKGYQKNNIFLTNDPGTKRGLNYPYSFETLYRAAADWNHALNSADPDKKVAILIWK